MEITGTQECIKVHTANLKWLNPVEGGEIGVQGYVEFSSQKSVIEVIEK
jgi:hypothetical protein